MCWNHGKNISNNVLRNIQSNDLTKHQLSYWTILSIFYYTTNNYNYILLNKKFRKYFFNSSFFFDTLNKKGKRNEENCLECQTFIMTSWSFMNDDLVRAMGIVWFEICYEIFVEKIKWWVHPHNYTI